MRTSILITPVFSSSSLSNGSYCIVWCTIECIIMCWSCVLGPALTECQPLIRAANTLSTAFIAVCHSTHLVTIQILVSQFELAFVCRFRIKHYSLHIESRLSNRNFTESFKHTRARSSIQFNIAIREWETHNWWPVWRLSLLLWLEWKTTDLHTEKHAYAAWHYLRQLKYLTYVKCNSDYSPYDVCLFVCCCFFFVCMILGFGPLLVHFVVFIFRLRKFVHFSTHFLWKLLLMCVSVRCLVSRVGFGFVFVFVFCFFIYLFICVFVVFSQCIARILIVEHVMDGAHHNKRQNKRAESKNTHQLATTQVIVSWEF